MSDNRPTDRPADRSDTAVPIDQVARRARRLIYAAALGLSAIGILVVALGLEGWPTTAAGWHQALADSLSDSGTLFVAVPAVAFLGTAFFLRRSRRLASGTSPRVARGHLWIAGLTGLYVLGMALGGWQQVRAMRADFQEERLAQQVGIARLKARQIDDWAHERMMTLQFLAGSLRTMPLDLVATNPQMRQLVELTLAQFLAANPERVAAALFLADGTPLVTAGAFESEQAADLATLVREASKKRGITAGPVHAGGATPLGLSIPFLDTIDVPVPGKAPDRMVVVSMIDPMLGVLKGFGEWPTASPSSELELVYRDGDEIVHVVTGKEVAEAPPLSLRNRVQNDALVGARAVKTGQGVWDAEDHHGQRVLAASYHLKTFPWIVIAKTDYAEAMRPIDIETTKIWAMIGGLILLGGLVALALDAQLTMADALQRLGR